MRGDLGERRDFQRQGRQHDQVEAAVLEIGLEQPIERQQGRQHGRHPQHTSGDARQQAQIGADAQRHQRDDTREEGERQRGTAPCPYRKTDVAREQCEEWGHRANLSVSHSKPMASCVEATTIPPDAQCAATVCATSFLPAVSSAAKGSSSSHKERAHNLRRASASRRFCPAERYWPGRSARPKIPKVSIAASDAPSRP